MQIVIQEYLLLFVRVLVTVMMVVYNIFAVLMSRQIGIMTKTVSMKDSAVITLFGYVHLGFSVVVLLLALFSL